MEEPRYQIQGNKGNNLFFHGGVDIDNNSNEDSSYDSFEGEPDAATEQEGTYQELGNQKAHDTEAKSVDELDHPACFSAELDGETAFNILSQDLAYAVQLQEDAELAENLEREERNRMGIRTGFGSQVEFDAQTARDIYNKELAYVTQLQEDEALARTLEQEEISRQRHQPRGRLRSVGQSNSDRPVAVANVSMFPIGVTQHDIPSSYELQEDMALIRALNEEENGQLPQNPQSRQHVMQDDIPNDYEALWNLAEQIGEVQSRGLENEELQCLPSQVYTSPQGSAATKAKKAADEDRHCAICREDFTSGDDLRILPCCHRYHKECLDLWLQTKAVCPVCNLDVKDHLKQTADQQ